METTTDRVDENRARELEIRDVEIGVETFEGAFVRLVPETDAELHVLRQNTPRIVASAQK